MDLLWQVVIMSTMKIKLERLKHHIAVGCDDTCNSFNWLDGLEKKYTSRLFFLLALDNIVPDVSTNVEDMFWMFM